MIRLDDEFLSGVGLGTLPRAEKRSLLTAFESELQQRVGQRLAGGLTEEQLDQFEALVDGASVDEAMAWLELHVPHHRDVVRATFELMRDELAEMAPAILAMAPPT